MGGRPFRPAFRSCVVVCAAVQPSRTFLAQVQEIELARERSREVLAMFGVGQGLNERGCGNAQAKLFVRGSRPACGWPKRGARRLPASIQLWG